MRISDWSSDVCSSDLPDPLRRRRRMSDPGDRRGGGGPAAAGGTGRRLVPRRLRAGPQSDDVGRGGAGRDRKSVVWGKSVSVRVDLGGRRLITKKKKIQQETTCTRSIKTTHKKT